MKNSMISYLSDLEQNNDRQWYHGHKEEKRAAVKEFEDLIQALILEIGTWDRTALHNEPRNLIFKLNRDTRFSADKQPYHPVFRCHIAAAGKLPVPVGYFLYILPEKVIFGRRAVCRYVQGRHIPHQGIHTRA